MIVYFCVVQVYKRFLVNREPILAPFSCLFIVVIHSDEASRAVSIKENTCIHWFSDNSTAGLFRPTKKNFLG